MPVDIIKETISFLLNVLFIIVRVQNDDCFVNVIEIDNSSGYICYTYLFYKGFIYFGLFWYIILGLQLDYLLCLWIQFFCVLIECNCQNP